MAGSRGPEWAGVQDLENGIAHVIGCQMTVDVLLEQARLVGHRRILAEAYRLEEELEALRAWLAGVRSRLPLGEEAALGTAVSLTPKTLTPALSQGERGDGPPFARG